MRVEYVNTVTGQAAAIDLPEGLNPVRVGSAQQNHVVLDSPLAGAETLALDNDVAGGLGWRLWNRCGKPVRVGGVTLTERNQLVRLTKAQVAVDCWPFVLTVRFTPGELSEADDRVGRLDRACARLVREVHADLVALHPDDPADPAEWQRDGYLYELERQTHDLTAARPDFPADDLAETELCSHLAGVAVRSAVVAHLVATHRPTERPSATPPADWRRPRLTVPDLEAELGALTAETITSLNVGRLTDLSDQVAAVDAGFWPFWTGRLAGGRVPPRTRRYLALRRLVKEVKDVWYGFGPLEDLLDDPSVTEIMVVGEDNIFIEKDGEIERSGRRFLTDPLAVIQRIMALAHRQINAAQPLADARLPDGSRVNAVIDPLSLSGPVLTIRRFPQNRRDLDELVRQGSLSASARAFLRAAVVGRRNILVAGGTGTGKTTLLNGLSQCIPLKERIVTVEDTAELRLGHPHVVTLQSKPKNLEGAGQVTIRELVRNALRMRPDRIVVGECRGGEAIDMLQAMNTGHDGSLTTLHANTPDGVIRRLEVLVQQDADSQLPVHTIHHQIGSALDLIVQLGREGRRRLVTEVTEVREDGAGLVLVPLYRREPGGPLAPTGCLPSFALDLMAAGLVNDPLDLVRD